LMDVWNDPGNKGVSRIRVTGPSLTSATCISAPYHPVITGFST